MGIDVVLVRAFADVENAFINAIFEDDNRTPRLPVEVDVLTHGALDDGIAHQEIVEVVAGITQHQRLELRIARTLVREELVGQTFLAKAFVGIDGQ